MPFFFFFCGFYLEFKQSTYVIELKVPLFCLFVSSLFVVVADDGGVFSSCLATVVSVW